MIVECSYCRARFDDEFRDTICPHDTFAANDGENHFRHHEDAYLEPEPKTKPSVRKPENS